LQLKDVRMSQDAFTKLRMLAQSGREALEAVLSNGSPADDPHFERLLGKIYMWAKSNAVYAAAA
jgi:hypothetical protein